MDLRQKYEIYVLLCIEIHEKRATMDPALFIARRTARSGSGKDAGVMGRIAVVSVALSIAVMLVSIAVMMGFKREIADKIAGFAGHAVLTDIRAVQTLDATPVRRTEHLDSLIGSVPAIVAAMPYGSSKAICPASATASAPKTC